MATCVFLEHVLKPQERKVESILPGSRIADHDPGWRSAYIAVLDGSPILRKDWDLVIIDGQVLAFIDARAIPQGGGGGGSKNPMRTIAMLAVMVLATATQQYYVSAGLLGGAVGGAIAGAVVGVAGMALVNALIPPSTQQLSGLKQVEQSSPSPTYSLDAQGNTARLGSAIPEHFGRHIVWPDLAAQPYQEYSGNEQFLYQLMCIGRGYYDIESIKIEETDINNFDEIDYEVIEPHGELTLFPGNVITSGEVAGQDMPYNVYVGPFVASATGTEANYLGVDFVAPRGLYEVRTNGSLKKISVEVRVEARTVDVNGDPVGDWAILGQHTYTASSATPLRYSRKYEVVPDRYEVRVRRDNEKETGTSYAHDFVWAGMRAYLEDTTDYGDCTLIAFKMKASSQLTQQSSRRINLLATRKLPTWDGSAWTSRQPTRSIAWAAAYAATEMGWPDELIDLGALHTLNGTWTSRGDTFDARFDNFITAWEAIQKIVASGRAQSFIQAGLIRFHRDQSQSIPVAVFDMGNIVKGSFEIEYLMPTQETADVVDVRYFDGNVWAYRTVEAKLPTSASTKHAKIELFGVIDRDHAFREGMYQAADNKYRRKRIKFQTEMGGLIPSPGDLIAVQHDLPAWGQRGEVLAYDYDALTVTTSEPLEFKLGETHYMALRRLDGSMVGPFECTAGGNEFAAVLAEQPTMTMQTDISKGDRTTYLFGWGATTYQSAIMISAMPQSGGNLVDVLCVNEDSNVHTAEIGEITPPAITSQLPNFTAAPRVQNIIVRSKPDDPGVMVISWQPAAWADSYLIEISSDYESWVQVGETRSARYTGPASFGNSTIVRIAAMGMTRGAWAYVVYADSSDFMWDADDTTLMWDIDDTTLMWS